MIYTIKEEHLHSNSHNINQTYNYKDKNNKNWVIHLTNSNGMYLVYSEIDRIEKTKFFLQDLNMDVEHTGVFYIDNTDFELFYNIRNTLLNKYTCNIWDMLENYFNENKFSETN